MHLSRGFSPWEMEREGIKWVKVQAVLCCLLGDCLFFIFSDLHFLLSYHPSPHGDITVAMPLWLELIPCEPDPAAPGSFHIVPVSFHLQGLKPWCWLFFCSYLPAPSLCSDALQPLEEQDVYLTFCPSQWTVNQCGASRGLRLAWAVDLPSLASAIHHKRNRLQWVLWSKNWGIPEADLDQTEGHIQTLPSWDQPNEISRAAQPKHTCVSENK